MQAAKLSLLSMHDKDVKLELISQSVQEVLAGGKVGGCGVGLHVCCCVG
jgi:hypothetical protein